MSDLDLDLDNYKLSELLKIYKFDSLPDNELVVDDIYNNKINNSNISTELKNFLFNVKMRIKMEIRDKINKEKIKKLESKPKKEINHKEKTRSTYLCIDSRFRNNYYNTSSNDFVIDLPYEFNNVVKLGLMSIEIINSITTLSVEQENNKFDISYVSVDQSGNFLCNVIVEDGNYSHTEFAEEINSDLFKCFGNRLTIEFNKKTGKTKIIAQQEEGKFSVYFGENYHEPFNTLGYKMGFRKREYINVCDLESEALFDLTGEKYFFLYVDDYNCNYYKDTIISIQSNDYLTKNILGRITMGGDQYQVVYEDTSDLIKKERKYTGPVNLKKLHIKLLNVYGNIANINSMDYSIILEVVQKVTT